MDVPSLSLIDEHARVIDMPPERAWAAVIDMLGHLTSGTTAKRYARLIGCDPVAPDGAFPATGGTIAGFRVAHADPPRAITLRGRHRFADYTFEFLLEPTAGARVVEGHGEGIGGWDDDASGRILGRNAGRRCG